MIGGATGRIPNIERLLQICSPLELDSTVKHDGGLAYCDVVLFVQSLKFIPHPRFWFAKAIVVHRGQNSKRDPRELSRGTGHVMVWGIRSVGKLKTASRVRDLTSLAMFAIFLSQASRLLFFFPLSPP